MVFSFFYSYFQNLNFATVLFSFCISYNNGINTYKFFAFGFYKHGSQFMKRHSKIRIKLHRIQSFRINHNKF